MNRRKLLQSMIALPALGFLNSCKRSEAPAKGTLKVFLHGPFALIWQASNPQRIKAFVPMDPQKQHEFYFKTPFNFAGDESQGKKYSFELADKGLDLSGRPPYIDRGFDDFRLRLTGEWTPTPDKYFVYLDLPTPDLITFMGQAEGVLFKDGRTGLMPLDHVLEYRMRDTNDVQLRSRELGDHGPVSCNDLGKEYHKHWESKEHRQSTPSQRPSIEEELSRCSHDDVSAYFFGVGLSEKTLDPELFSHAKAFFNEVLLPSFPPAARKERLQLERILGYGQTCVTTDTTANLPVLSPAVYRDSMAQPHLQSVAAVDDCKAGGLIGIGGG